MKLPANLADRDSNDITHIFQEMLGNTCAVTQTKKNKLKPTTPFKNYTKSLTARVNNVNACDGNSEWSQTNTAHDLYNKEVKCIGTNPSDFELGDPISLDLQPLSTTVDIMLDLQVITQGACIERKVAEPEPEPVPEPANEMEKPFEDKSRKFLCINRIKIERLNDDQTLDDDQCVDSFTYNHELKIQNECIKTSICSKKISNQNNEDSKQIFNCRIEKIKPKNEETNSKRLSKSISTCTDDLLDQNSVGSYSKYQLLSSDSLHKCSSTLVDSSTSFENMETKKVEELTTEIEKEETSVETYDALECLNIPLNVKISNKTKLTQKKNESDDEIDIKIPVESDNVCLKKSTEWSIFKNIQENLPKNFHLKSETMSMFSTLTNTRETLHKTTICKN